MPPKPSELVEVEDGMALRRAINHTVAATDWDASRGQDPTDFDFVGIRAVDDRVSLDARNRAAAAQAHLPRGSANTAALEVMVDYLWLRRVGETVLAGPMQFGTVESATEKTLFMLSGPGWAAWTSGVTPWRARFTPVQDDPRVSVNIPRDDVHRFVVDAKRLAESGSTGNNSWLLQATIAENAIELASVDDGEGATTGALRVPVTCQISEQLVTHFHVGRLLDALNPFPKQEVTLHIAQSGVAFVTTAGYKPADRPPALWATTTATPRDPSHSPPATTVEKQRTSTRSDGRP